MRPVSQPSTDARADSGSYFNSDRHSDTDTRADSGTYFNSNHHSDTDIHANAGAYFNSDHDPNPGGHARRYPSASASIAISLADDEHAR